MPLDRKAIARLRKKQLNGLYAVGVALTDEAKKRATRHTDNGTRRNSITQTKKDGHVLWGIPLKSAPHAPYLELGFKPHFVPKQHIGLWAKRHKLSKRVKRAGGLYVGGPGSTLQSGRGGASGYQFVGRGKRVRRTWSTKGGKSKYLPNGKVGHPVLVPTAHKARAIAPRAFIRGFQRG